MKAKKSLGQHFLKSGRALEKIISASTVGPGDVVLEIGPGKGVLTKKLLETGAKVVAVEKDSDLVPVLEEKFSEYGDNFLLVHEDVLSFDPEKYISGSYTLVANIPYYITGAILELFLSGKHQPNKMVLLVQKEVAERIAKEKKESILSLSVKAYGEPKYVMSVSKNNFSPPPAVDSAILLIENISKNFFKDEDEEKNFFAVVKLGFSQKRKLLLNNLKGLREKDELLEKFSACNIEEKARPEDVPKENWLCLAKKLNF